MVSDHVAIGMTVFWEQEDPEDPYHYQYHDEPTFKCPVCRSNNDAPGCCSKDCYDVWTAESDEDPMDFYRF